MFEALAETLALAEKSRKLRWEILGPEVKIQVENLAFLQLFSQAWGLDVAVSS